MCNIQCSKIKWKFSVWEKNEETFRMVSTPACEPACTLMQFYRIIHTADYDHHLFSSIFLFVLIFFCCSFAYFHMRIMLFFSIALFRFFEIQLNNNIEGTFNFKLIFNSIFDCFLFHLASADSRHLSVSFIIP